MEPPQAGDRGGLPPFERFGGQDDIGGPNCAAANCPQSNKALPACSGDPKTRPCYLCPWFLGVKWSLSALGLMSSCLGPKYKVKAETKVLTGRARGALQLRTQTKTAFPPSSPAAHSHSSPAFSGALPWALEGSLPVLPLPELDPGTISGDVPAVPSCRSSSSPPWLALPTSSVRLAKGRRKVEHFPPERVVGLGRLLPRWTAQRQGLGRPASPWGRLKRLLLPCTAANDATPVLGFYPEVGEHPGRRLVGLGEVPMPWQCPGHLPPACSWPAPSVLPSA